MGISVNVMGIPWLRVAIGIVFALIGTGALVLGFLSLVRTVLLKRRGVRTKATVLEDIIEVSRRRNRVTEFHYPRLEFMDGAGIKHAFKASVGTQNVTPVGSTVPVIYDPERPEDARMDRFMQWYGGFLLGIFFAAGFLFFACLLLFDRPELSGGQF